MTSASKTSPPRARRLATFLAGLVALVWTAAPARADSITSLFSTGVGSDGQPLAFDAVDPHYTLISSPNPATIGPNSFVVLPIHPQDGCWTPACAGSKWIAPQADQSIGHEPGFYTFRTQFDLTGFIPSTATISGQWTMDNEGVAILLNGQEVTGIDIPKESFTRPAHHPFQDLHSFTITSGFQEGINTLDFVIYNIPDELFDPVFDNHIAQPVTPVGIDVCLTGAAQLVPEPGSLALAGIGIVGIAAYRARRRKA